MKKVFGILLVMVLMMTAVSAVAETDFDTLVAANRTATVLESVDSSEQKAVEYDPATGEVVDSWTCYIWHGENGEWMEAFAYESGHWEIIGAGKGCGYSVNMGSVYEQGFVGSAYEDLLLYYQNQNVGEFTVGQQIVAEETTEDGKLHITIEGPPDPFYGEAYQGQTLTYEYIVNPETLIIEASDTYVPMEDGSKALYFHSEHAVNTEFEIPDFYTEIEGAKELREVHVIMDPGTDKECEYVLETPLNMAIAIQLPTDYVLFADAECTQFTDGVPEKDENGNYPATDTVYAAPYAG